MIPETQSQKLQGKPLIIDTILAVDTKSVLLASPATAESRKLGNSPLLLQPSSSTTQYPNLYNQGKNCLYVRWYKYSSLSISYEIRWYEYDQPSLLSYFIPKPYGILSTYTCLFIRIEY
jgi:hypothetical protein